MPRCESCGNDYDKAFEVVMAGRHHVFDSFECAIHLLAPGCAHCGGPGHRARRGGGRRRLLTFDPLIVWNVQIAVIVVGHVMGVYVAHVIALRTFGLRPSRSGASSRCWS